MTDTPGKRKWIARGAWAIADQGFFAVASVLLNVLLARWLAPAEYGAFAVGYALFLLLATFHTAFITEPMLVFGAGKYSTRKQQYLQTLIRAHWRLTGAGSLLLVLVAFLLRLGGVGPIADMLFGLALSMPFFLLLWFARRSAYLLLKPRLATFASAIYALLIVSGLLALFHFQWLTTFTAMLTLGVPGAIAGWGLLRSLGNATEKQDLQTAAIPVLADHWQYGRWACATSILSWVPLNFFFVMLSVAVSLQASANLKALSNLVLPLLQINAALGTLLLPAMVTRVADSENFGKLLRLSLVLFASVAILYALIVGAVGSAIVPLLYGNRYSSNSELLWLLLLIPILDGVMMVLSSALRSLLQPKKVFWAQLAVATCVLLLGVPATNAAGLRGAATVIVVACFVGVLVLAGGVFVTFPVRATTTRTISQTVAEAGPALS